MDTAIATPDPRKCHYCSNTRDLAMMKFQARDGIEERPLCPNCYDEFMDASREAPETMLDDDYTGNEDCYTDGGGI
jgi:hypothetical protein